MSAWDAKAAEVEQRWAGAQEDLARHRATMELARMRNLPAGRVEGLIARLQMWRDFFGEYQRVARASGLDPAARFSVLVDAIVADLDAQLADAG